MQFGDFFTKKKNELGVTLNEVQKEAVLTNEGPLLLLASPGSGKTTTIIMKIGYLIEVLGVHPSRIKAVTFSRASAKDMEERFQRFFPDLPLVDFSTIHSLAYQVVREYFAKQRIEYQLIEGNNEGYNKKIILRDIYKAINHEPITEDQLEELITFISYIKNKLIPENEWSSISISIPKKEQIVKRYEQFKTNGSPKLLLDFDDMLIIANQVLENNKDILRRYQERYDYILTDESQDTSLVQHFIIEKLVQQHQNLCVVADEDQSIYSWRGAEPQYLLDFKKIYPNAKILMMVQNYRSSKDIVEVANTFIKQNKKRYNKNMFTENPSHERIKIKSLKDYQVQATYLINQISTIDNLQDVAILYRNNSSSILLIDAFDKANIPFYMKDVDNRFFHHWVVEDIKNFMRLSYNTSRVDVFERIYSKFNGYFKLSQMEQLKKVQNNESVFDNLLSSVKLEDYQNKKIVHFKKTYDRMHDASPKRVLQMIRDDLGFERVLEYRSEKFGYNLNNLIELLNTLEQIADSTTTMVEFVNRLNHLDSLMKTSKFNKGKNAVTFSTLHSSKGLEFQTVYMIDLIDGIIPSHTKDEDEGGEEEREEEVRLFYVGMTRAIAHLELISYARKFHAPVKKSEFIDQVHQIMHPNDQKKPIKREKKVKERPANPNGIKERSLLKVGLKVKHIVFGPGEIVSCDDELLEIRFNNGKKKFQIATCLKQGFLEIE
ncbi:DNA helicase-2/ATP-dependent DNA helicase PcrA [Ureibacillus xyleni]|uniref:DNA 3'-5' helicase n=1 Tax=Ureibacillus xyleni TaxID=614648 RepID=A0A285T3V9_9BACL|nr:ATP-dependent helicase [Ureibacillus xyleni]SOC15824.1 DNA helicase-2/ATP-dependent DNA helicase PcrA [Ureibacillus xyleni]